MKERVSKETFVHEALFFVWNKIYFNHFNNEKEDYLYFETALLIIKKDELLLISKGLDYSYFGESRIKVKVNWCQLCLFCISLLSIKKSENHSLLKQLLIYIVFYTQYVIYELILTLIMKIVNNISKKYFLNLYN